jgi:hypothetical protein
MGRLLILFSAFFLCVPPAEACSVVAGYKIPTNFELVKEASVIVLARVKEVGAMDDKTSPFDHPSVTLELVRFLKGSAPAAQLRLIGWSAPLSLAGVPTATTLSQSHWSTGIGGCIRQFYSPGELVVAMFHSDPEAKKRSGLDLVQVFKPFARAVETVDRPDDIWVHAVERYVALQSGPSTGEKGRIQQEIDRLQAAPGAEAQAIADDLRYNLTRKDPENAWATFSSPVTSMSAVMGQRGASLYCIAGTVPGVMVPGPSASNLAIRVGPTTLALSPATLSAIEKSLISARSDTPPNLFHFTDAKAALAVIRETSEQVAITAGGAILAGGRPLDALVRWASQCEKLQTERAPAESKLRDQM